MRAECLGIGTLLISRFEVKSLGSAASTFQQSWWHRNWTFKFLLFLALIRKEFHWNKVLKSEIHYSVFLSYWDTIPTMETHRYKVFGSLLTWLFIAIVAPFQNHWQMWNLIVKKTINSQVVMAHTCLSSTINETWRNGVHIWHEQSLMQQLTLLGATDNLYSMG